MKKKMFTLVLAAAMTIGSLGTAVDVQAASKGTEQTDLQRYLIPYPVQYEVGEGAFILGEDASICVQGATEEENAELVRTAEYIAEKFRTSTGYALPVKEGIGDTDGNIVLTTVAGDEDLGEEGYQIETTEDGIKVWAAEPEGVFRGVQTLRQLFPADIEKQEAAEDVEWAVPVSYVKDEPEYDYRGMHIDVTRHFFTVEQIERQIDLLAQYKINKLHMHLSDDQGWRLEIKGELFGESLDKLNTIGAQTSGSRNGINPGQYTQEEFKEIVAYAQERYVEIIPEFDMPGHTWAALVSLNFLNSTEDGRPYAKGYDNTKPYEGMNVGFSTLECRNEKTYAFVEEVIKQVAAISPSNYIHIGGDEAHSTSSEDYAYFLQRVTAIAKKYGKTPIGWQNYDREGVLSEEEREGTVTQFWSTGNAKMKDGVDYILTPADHAYVDMKYDRNSKYGLSWAGLCPIEKAYNWEPTTYGAREHIVGVEASLWTETIATDEALDYMIYPRVLGIAEIAWAKTGSEFRTWDNYKERLVHQDERLDNLGVEFYRDENLWVESSVKKGLRKLIKAVEELNSSEYTAESWGEMETALAGAKKVLSDKDAVSNEQDKALADLIAAYGKLEYGVQKLHLQTAIEAADAILALGNNYEETADLAAAVEAGKIVLADADASQEEADNAAYTVLDELAKMAKKADIKSLESLIEAAKKLLDGSYTSTTLENLRDAIAKAEAVVADQNRGDNDISSAYSELIDAIIKLEMKGNKAALKAMLAKANEILENADAYTSDSIDGLAEAVADAQKVYDDEDAVQNEINEAVKALTLKAADARLKGDVNNDGKVDTNDSAAVLKASAELIDLDTDAQMAADVNGDGAADTNDAVLILQYAAETVTMF